jgi:hypothetical protein
MLRMSLVLCLLAFAADSVTAQEPPASIALEADALAYGLPGYSGILNVSLPSGFQVAVGAGRYRHPSFLLSGDANYDAVGWTATSTSIQVVRVTYRFNGPMKNGPAAGIAVLNQNIRLRAERLTGETKFSEISVGPSGGYYQHIGKHFYLYPTAAYTRNSVYSGETTLQGVPYTVEKWALNYSLHAGWDWEWNRR